MIFLSAVWSAEGLGSVGENEDCLKTYDAAWLYCKAETGSALLLLGELAALLLLAEVVEHQRVGVQVRAGIAGSHCVGDLAGGLDLSQLNETWVVADSLLFPSSSYDIIVSLWGATRNPTRAILTSPTNLADCASPCALITMVLFSCSAFSTMYLARSASC